MVADAFEATKTIGKITGFFLTVWQAGFGYDDYPIAIAIVGFSFSADNKAKENKKVMDFWDQTLRSQLMEMQSDIPCETKTIPVGNAAVVNTEQSKRVEIELDNAFEQLI